MRKKYNPIMVDVFKFCFILFLGSVLAFSCTEKVKEAGSEEIAADTTSEMVGDGLSSVKADEYTEEEVVLSEEVSETTFAGEMSHNNTSLFITMLLNMDTVENEVRGSYFYEANPKKEDIKLAGSLINNELYLTETSNTGKVSGYFKATIMGQDTIKGIWESANHKRKLTFWVALSDMDYQLRKAGAKADPEEE